MDRINPQNVNIVTRSIQSPYAASVSGAGRSGGDTFQIGNLPPIPKWVGVAVVAATTALGAAGCYYYFYSRSKGSPKKTGSEPSKDSSSADLKELGNEYFKKLDFANAIDCYTKAIQSGSKTPEQLAVLYQNRAAVFEKLGDKLQVINECTCALKYNPKYVKALTRRAKAYKETGFLKESLEDVTTACILDNFQHGSTVQLIDELVKELGIEEAKKIFKARQPSEPSQQYIITFLRSFHDDPVSKFWYSAQSRNSSSADRSPMNGSENSEPDSGYALAIENLKANKFSGIIQLCTEEIQKSESSAKLDAHLLRGTFKHLYGYKSTDVLEDFKAILEGEAASDQLRSSTWVKAGLSLFNGSWENEQKDTWKEAFEKATKANPKNVDVYFQWGQLLLFKGEFAEAQDKISQAVQCTQTFPFPEATGAFLRYRLALMRENSMEMGEAFVEFDTLQKKWPKCPEVFAFYGQILMELQRFDEALAAFDKVIKLDPGHTNALVHTVLCKAHKASGMGDINFDALLKELRSSLAVDSRNGFVWETIATLEVQAGNKDGAADAIDRAIECARSFPEIAMLSSLKVGSEMQFKVKEKLNTS